jgi:hypothetical protein
LPANLKSLRAADNYYATTLQLLSLIAVRMRFPSLSQRYQWLEATLRTYQRLSQRRMFASRSKSAR